MKWNIILKVIIHIKIIEIVMEIQIKLNNTFIEKYKVYNGQTSEEIAEELTQKHKLDDNVKNMIKQGIQKQLNLLS